MHRPAALRRPAPAHHPCPALCPAPPRRRWMKVVLQPLNEKAADVIVNHVDLLRTPYIDPLLLQARLL